jgi:hypothetical protein
MASIADNCSILFKPSKLAIGMPVIRVRFLVVRLTASFSTSLTANLLTSDSFIFLG